MSQKPETETRSVILPVEHREAGSVSTLAGYAAVFGEAADIGGYFREVFAQGAFTETLKTADVRAYFGHDRGRVLGRVSAGTLRLREDTKGLAVEIDLPDTTDGRDAKVSVDRKDITGMSFAFRATREEWDETSNPPTRTIYSAEVYEVSIVSEPAYEGTSVALRSLEAVRQEKRQHPAQRRIEARRAQMEQRFRGLA